MGQNHANSEFLSFFGFGSSSISKVVVVFLYFEIDSILNRTYERVTPLPSPPSPTAPGQVVFFEKLTSLSISRRYIYTGERHSHPSRPVDRV